MSVKKCRHHEKGIARREAYFLVSASSENTYMKNHPLRSIATALAAGLGTANLASAHPGHSVLDFTAGPPHAGHESEIGTLLIATALTLALFAGARLLTSRRR